MSREPFRVVLTRFGGIKNNYDESRMTACCLIYCTQLASANSIRNLNGESSKEVKLMIGDRLHAQNQL